MHSTTLSCKGRGIALPKQLVKLIRAPEQLSETMPQLSSGILSSQARVGERDQSACPRESHWAKSHSLTTSFTHLESGFKKKNHVSPVLPQCFNRGPGLLLRGPPSFLLQTHSCGLIFQVFCRKPSLIPVQSPEKLPRSPDLSSRAPWLNIYCDFE